MHTSNHFDHINVTHKLTKLQNLNNKSRWFDVLPPWVLEKMGEWMFWWGGLLELGGNLVGAAGCIAMARGWVGKRWRACLLVFFDRWLIVIMVNFDLLWLSVTSQKMSFTDLDLVQTIAISSKQSQAIEPWSIGPKSLILGLILGSKTIQN